MEDALALHVPVARRLVRHQPLTLGRADLDAQVRLGRLAEEAVAALWRVEGNHMVANLKPSHTLANALDNTSSLRIAR